MNAVFKTLWDLLEPKDVPARAKAPADRPIPMRDRYESVTRHMLEQHNVRVRRWRTSMSGVAWQVTYRDGTVSRLIESPRPRGPVSAAIFLHEIGHHAIGFDRYRPRCLEEYHAWRFSLDAMADHDLNITPPVYRRVDESLRYAIEKAARRGLKQVPVEIVEYLRSLPIDRSSPTDDEPDTSGPNEH